MVSPSLRRLAVCLAVLTCAVTSARADDPKVIRSQVVVTPSRFGNYWPNPKAKEPQYNTWSWLPRISFTVLGPIEPGSELSAEWMLPDGRPWITTPFQTPEVAAGATYTFSNGYSTQESGKPAKTLIGTFPFRIRLKNELSGTNKVIFSGKYTVTKFHKGNALPQFKNQFEYVADQDWRLPIGYLAANYQLDDKMPGLTAMLWFKGDKGEPKGYLYHEGTLIGSMDLRAGTVNNPFSIMTSGMDTNDPVWQLWTISWSLVRLYNLEPQYNHLSAEGWLLSEHPGNYEIKVMRASKLARSLKFTIDKEGKLVDNGVAAANNAGAVVIVPVQVLGTTDGTWNKAGATASAYYFNPLKGFTAP